MWLKCIPLRIASNKKKYNTREGTDWRLALALCLPSSHLEPQLLLSLPSAAYATWVLEPQNLPKTRQTSCLERIEWSVITGC